MNKCGGIVGTEGAGKLCNSIRFYRFQKRSSIALE